MNFATFFAQSVKDRSRKIKRGKYKGQFRGIKSKPDLQMPGPAYHPEASASKLNAPSASTYVERG